MNAEEAAHEATLARWRKRTEMAKETGELATEAVQGIFKKILRNKEMRRSIAKDIVNMSRGEASQFKGTETGSLLRDFNDPGVNAWGIPTGEGERSTYVEGEDDID